MTSLHPNTPVTASADGSAGDEAQPAEENRRADEKGNQ